ncbi:hypothetical protein L3Q82_009082 [Scortum barcoo]|uniref:Uncharacterized protein n=1 Tax=Scortum barcoo TaxID=214431 RepID=A0ACB8XBC4_9TELE|nr:hypothetical protein L3Q82_009082 [Scortum barcoo]
MHLFRMPPGRLPLGRCSRRVPPGGGLGEDPGHAGETMSLELAWERLGIPLEELEEVSGVREVWASLLRLLPPRPDQKIKNVQKKLDYFLIQQFENGGALEDS